MDFKEAAREKAKKLEQMQKQNLQINQTLLKELPLLYAQAAGYFLELAQDTPIAVDKRPAAKHLFWAYNNEPIGDVTVNDYTLTLQNNSLSLSLDPSIGYVGAHAKINIKSSPAQRLPINKEGLFMDVAINPGESNAIKYLDFRNKVHRFDEQMAERIMRMVLLGESPNDPNVERWG